MIKILDASEALALRKDLMAGKLSKEEFGREILRKSSEKYFLENESPLERKIRLEWFEGMMVSYTPYVTFFFYPFLDVIYSNDEFEKAKAELEELGYKVLSAGSSIGNAVLPLED